MASFKKGDIVARQSHNMDVLFKITELQVKEDGQKQAILKGIDYRLICDAPLEDLVPVANS